MHVRRIPYIFDEKAFRRQVSLYVERCHADSIERCHADSIVCCTMTSRHAVCMLWRQHSRPELVHLLTVC